MESYYSIFKTPKQINRLMRIVRSRFYIHTSQDLRHSIFLSGTGRSGTTWLAEMIDSQIPSRLMFEPFFLNKIIPVSQFHLFQYMRPEQEDGELYNLAYKVLTGKIRDPRIDWHNKRLYTQYRIIKEIRANLFLKWLHDRFPQVPLFFVIRHPCAVALSRKELGWATDTDIDPFLRQENLINDYLSDKLDLIHSLKTDIEKHALIWSISNLVPLSQFGPEKLNMVYYENLCLQPESELAKVFKVLDQGHLNITGIDVQRPSVTTTHTSAIVTGEDRITRWKSHLQTSEIDSVLNIVREFGLDDLYGDAVTPRDSVRLELK
jgi:hypothetical protein